MINLKMMPHQSEFCNDITTKYLALIGGFGCGKTKAFTYKTIIMSSLNVGYEGAITEPTQHLLKTHLIPNMITSLEELKIPYDFSKSDSIFTLHFKEGSTKIYCLSGENYTRLVGYNLAFFGSDETDTSPQNIAQEMWNKAISRCRWGRYIQLYTTSTPEGYKFLYDFFKLKANDKKRCIHAASSDNPLLPADYLESMKENYTDAQWKVWALGQFGNLNTSTVYYTYDRNLNNSILTIKDNSRGNPLYIGMDFNIDHMAAIVHIIKNNDPHAIEEICNVRDVPTMIKIIKERYPHNEIWVYPDASGKNRNATGMDTSHALLRAAGFKILVNPANPPVGDRINSMNSMFCNAAGIRRYFVNNKQCPQYVLSLERQAWVNNEPDKSNNVDHPLDAGGYFIHYVFPVKKKPTLRNY